jgi:hypothetical protein
MLSISWSRAGRYREKERERAGGWEGEEKEREGRLKFNIAENTSPIL